MPGEQSRIILPAEAKPGKPVRAEDFNRLRSAVVTLQKMMIARTPRSSSDVKVSFLPGGFSLTLGNQGGGGFATGSSEKPAPLTLMGSRPGYIPDPETAVPEGKRRFYMRIGTINGVVASNYDRTLDLSTSDANYIWAHVTFGNAEALSVSSWQLVVGDTENEHVTDNWGTDGRRPDEGWWLLSYTAVVEDVLYPLNVGGGSIEISEHVVNLREGPDGSAMIDKALLWTRQPY